jgi:hypothetical protein
MKLRMAHDELAGRAVESRSSVVAPWTVLARDNSQLLRCDILAGSSSYGHGAGRQAHLAGLRVAGKTGVGQAAATSFLQATMSEGRGHVVL